jgi:hypothetical protein
MHRHKFTRRTWYNEDKTTQFYMSENGSVDMLPGPNSALMRKLHGLLTEAQIDLLYPDRRKKTIWSKGNHIHWAHQPQEDK